jgi:GT2 family glycosyltransferase
MTTSAHTAIVIVTFNGMGCIDNCLRSFEGEPDLILHVLDNASDDGTPEHIAAAYPWVKLTRLPRNLGFGAANNLGIAEALLRGNPYTMLLNQDTVVPPGTVRALRDFMERYPEFAACSPLQCVADLSRPDPNTLVAYLAPHACDYLADLVAGEHRGHYAVHGLNAAVWLVRSTTFETAGGFDPLFFMYGEDDDLLARWRHHGLRFALVPAIRVAHTRYRAPAHTGEDTVSPVERTARRAYPRLLLDIKEPGHRASFMVRLWLVRGLLAPALDAAVDLDHVRLRGRWLAAWRVASRLATVVRHARLSAQPGCHFIPSGAGAAHPLSPDGSPDRTMVVKGATRP